MYSFELKTKRCVFHGYITLISHKLLSLSLHLGGELANNVHDNHESDEGKARRQNCVRATVRQIVERDRQEMIC